MLQGKWSALIQCQQQDVNLNESLMNFWVFFSLRATVLEDVVGLLEPPPIPLFSFMCVEFFHPNLFLPPIPLYRMGGAASNTM